MARINWKALQIEYIRANAKTGVSVKDWCAKKGLNLSTAKRYIKKPETVFEQAEKCEQNCETANIEKQDKSKDYSENCETNCESNCETAKSEVKSAQKTANKGGRPKIHGGYSCYFEDDSDFGIVKDFSLKDEIDLMRQRAVSAVKSIEKFTALLEEAETAEEKESYSKIIDSAGNALDRAVSRIESLNYTDNSILNILSQIELRKVQVKKVLAETDKLKQELNTKTAANNQIQFIQEFE
ncbi:TPA: terminase [Pasteurella multocida]|uniref:terminase n=1 Tax=Pasteurella multocida TaxID=747 RepID=UPI0029A541DE|nr:terminase [Pasteurella multocida]MDY0489276.1 terminase [Pasteurella multocida]HEH9616991.1 terminase [Pasteurella multocida]HEH9625685.1 terminase [Pasteurella multocida]HEH9638675.1 terminase [Pasteurella multocida]HEH9660980.1 terminase [Pasteurella multocida]